MHRPDQCGCSRMDATSGKPKLRHFIQIKRQLALEAVGPYLGSGGISALLPSCDDHLQIIHWYSLVRLGTTFKQIIDPPPPNPCPPTHTNSHTEAKHFALLPVRSNHDIVAKNDHPSLLSHNSVICEEHTKKHKKIPAA